MPEKTESLTFETAIKKLEDIIAGLEDEDLTLDKALKNFENGIKLMRTCENHLKNAEGKIKELLKGEDGALVEKVLGATRDSLNSGENSDE
jgi:exodeoxyribonuclease VII small subunit